MMHFFKITNSGCEGDLAATSVTPLIARVDSADLAGWWVSPSSLTDPGASLLKLHARWKRMVFPTRGEDWSSVKGIRVAALPDRTSKRALKITNNM